MSRASKLASARGQAHSARHSTNIAIEKLRRVTDDRDRLRAEVERLRKDAERYWWMRSRDLDSIVEGGVFAGKVPDNIVLNGEDLDAAIDAAIAAQKGSAA